MTVLFATLSVWLGVQLYWLRSEGSFAKGFNHELGKSPRLRMLCSPCSRTDASVKSLTHRSRWDSALIGPVQHLIEVEEKWFEGSPRFQNDGKEYVPEPEYEQSQYTGKPSQAVDHNWELLHWGEIYPEPLEFYMVCHDCR